MGEGPRQSFARVSPEGKRCDEAAWEAVLGANSAVSAGRKKSNKIKGGGRNAGRVKGLRDFLSPPASVVGFEDFQIQGGR